jgi:intracellular multiplication protein IcmC
MPDLMTILINFGSIAPLILEVGQGVMAMVGVFLTGMAIIEFYCTSNENAARFLPGAQRFTVGSGVAQLVIGALLISLSTLELVGIATRTFTETEVTSRLMAYQTSGNTLADETQAAAQGILLILQLIGFCAMAKSLFMLNARAHGTDSASAGMAYFFFGAGLVAWNFQLFAQVIDSETGFNILSYFTGATTS